MGTRFIELKVAVNNGHVKQFKRELRLLKDVKVLFRLSDLECEEFWLSGNEKSIDGIVANFGENVSVDIPTEIGRINY
jgi:hypothetical protein